MASSELKQENDIQPDILTKEELVSSVKIWIEMDTEINKINKQISNLKRQVQTINKDKKKITDKLIVVIKKNNADIAIGGHKLVHKVNKQKKTITKKYLLEQLNIYFKSQPEVAEDVSTQIMNNRPVIITENIILQTE